MNRLIYILAVMATLCLASCGGKEDEPEVEYTGPWGIYYEEHFSRTHNNSPEFKAWFNSHAPYFEMCKLFSSSGNVSEFYDYVEWDDYTNYIEGFIAWYEIVDYATEDEMKSKVEQYENFTIEDSKNPIIFDRFYAEYQKVEKQK